MHYRASSEQSLSLAHYEIAKQHRIQYTHRYCDISIIQPRVFRHF